MFARLIFFPAVSLVAQDNQKEWARVKTSKSSARCSITVHRGIVISALDIVDRLGSSSAYTAFVRFDMRDATCLNNVFTSVTVRTYTEDINKYPGLPPSFILAHSENL